jgi:hypothetical protein
LVTNIPVDRDQRLHVPGSSNRLYYIGFFYLQEDKPSPIPPVCACFECSTGPRFLSTLLF